MKLQFTNGYRPNFDQISRIMRYLLSQKGRKKVSNSEIVASTGIPAKQVKYLTSMMIGFGLVVPRVTTLTSFGRAIAQADTYFDKLETLWIIHYIVSSNQEWVVWYTIVNLVFPSNDRYSVKEISDEDFSDLAIHFSERTFAEKLPKEVGAVLAAYTRSELSNLGIVRLEETGSFVKADPVEIPDLAFLFCLIYFRDRYFTGSSAIMATDVCLAEYSPGRVLNLPEYRVRAILGNLHNAGLVRLEQFASLDQVRLNEGMTLDQVLRRIYGDIDAN